MELKRKRASFLFVIARLNYIMSLIRSSAILPLYASIATTATTIGVELNGRDGLQVVPVGTCPGDGVERLGFLERCPL